MTTSASSSRPAEVVGAFTVEAASSGPAALASLHEGELPDAVLLDVMMPGVDGLSLVRRLRQSDATCTLPVVLLTAKNVCHEFDQAHPGISGILRTPFNPMTLPGQLSALLGWSQEGGR